MRLQPVLGVVKFRLAIRKHWCYFNKENYSSTNGMRCGLHVVFKLVPASEGSCNLSFKDFSVSQEVKFDDNRETSSSDRQEEELLTRHSGLKLLSLRRYWP